MKRKELIRKVIIKIVNSRIIVEMKDNSLCEKDLRHELGASEKDMNAISSMLEKFFCILIEDEELEQITSVNDIFQLVLRKNEMKPENEVLV